MDTSFAANGLLLSPFSSNYHGAKDLAVDAYERLLIVGYGSVTSSGDDDNGFIRYWP